MSVTCCWDTKLTSRLFGWPVASFGWTVSSSCSRPLVRTWNRGGGKSTAPSRNSFPYSDSEKVRSGPLKTNPTMATQMFLEASGKTWEWKASSGGQKAAQLVSRAADTHASEHKERLKSSRLARWEQKGGSDSTFRPKHSRTHTWYRRTGKTLH